MQVETDGADEAAASPALVGQIVKRLRTERGMTIADLARQAGLSAGIISQIERGRSNPSMRTLQRLRAAFGVNMWEFLAAGAPATPAEPDAFIVRKGQRQSIVVGKSQLVKELLSPRNDRNLRFMLITLPSGGESEDVLQSPGEKGGYVLSGRVRLTVAGRTGDLETGDSFQFRADLPHRLANPFPEEARVLWIMSITDAHL